jgi:hypothetical protein
MCTTVNAPQKNILGSNTYTDFMWVTLIAAALGAVIATGSTLLSERARWSLGRSDRRRGDLKQSYASYLASLAKAVEQVWHAAREHDEKWSDRAMTAMRDHEVQEMRFELSLIAPIRVTRQAEEVSVLFAAWRDAAGAGARQGDEIFEKGWTDYCTSRGDLLEMMRRTLQDE